MNARLLATLTALALSTGCVATVLNEEQRQHITQVYTSQSRELSVSMWGSPFFVDGDHRYLSLAPPDEMDILDDTHGKPIWPGVADEVIPAGTKVTIARVSFPGRLANFTRHLETPRDRVWVELTVEGRSVTPSYVFVLRPDVQSDVDVSAEIDKLLTDKPLDAEIKALPALDQKTIATKEISTGASARALELAFGTPILKKISSDGTTRTEDWTWRSELQTRPAHLKDGVVISVEGPAVKRAPAAH